MTLRNDLIALVLSVVGLAVASIFSRRTRTVLRDLARGPAYVPPDGATWSSYSYTQGAAASQNLTVLSFWVKV